MALTRRDALLASIVGFVAWGYVVHWLPVLRYIGHTFLSGAILTIAVLLTIIFATSQRRQDGGSKNVYQRSSIRFLAPERWLAEVSSFNTGRNYSAARLYPPSSSISEALDRLVTLALRDFVSSWYGNITRDATFVNEVDQNIRLALEDIRDRLLQKDLVDIVVSRIVPLLTAHLKDFDQAERAIKGKALNRNVTESEELDLAIAAKYRDGKLHPAASLAYSDTKLVQQDHLRKLLVRVLPDVLPDTLLRSRATFVLVKEIVACAVLFPVMQMLADADTWNRVMEAYGRMALQDRKTVRKLRAALDRHASPVLASKHGAAFPTLAPGNSQRSFERFVRAIRRTNNVSDARRFRSHITSQLKRGSMVQNPDQTYLRRLEIGKRVLDQKVAKLSTGGNASLSLANQVDPRIQAVPHSQAATLVETMKTASGLSYFMEYMDRLNLMSLVQFWIVVDGFRNPLEDDFGDDASGADSISWTDTDRADIAQINEAYMSKPALAVPEDMQGDIRDFLRAGRSATASQYRRARTAILSTQSAVLEEMENRHFPNFKQTDLFYKYLASDEASASSHLQIESDMSVRAPLRNRNDQDKKPPPMVRSTSQPSTRSRDLRRTALSSSDLRAGAKVPNLPANARKSFDADGDRSGALFNNDDDTDPLTNSTYSLDGESHNHDASNQTQIIENMEAALNNIVTESPKIDQDVGSTGKVSVSPSSLEKSIFDDPPKGSLDVLQVESASEERIRPSIASLGLVNTSSRIGVFSDDDLFPDEKRFIEDEYADSEDTNKDETKDEEVHEAAPGDLGLAEAIAALTADTERLLSQESVVDALTRKAELTNNAAELRILNKSKLSLQRELRRKELQRQQYVVQESDNGLYGRSTISIKSIMVGKEEDGREYALYVIEVQRKAGEQISAASWIVARRYSEFHDLHHKLRSRYPSVRNLDFPRRRVVMKLQKDFLRKRRAALEGFLRQLLLLPEVCRSRELRSFLSQQAIVPQAQSAPASNATDIVTRIYNSVTDGMDDFLGNIAVLDQLSAAGQNLISAATTQINATPNGDISDNPVAIAEAEAELNAFEDRELEPFIKPICDMFLETFELNKGNNWFRGRAVVVVLHQLLGGTVERKIRDTAKAFLDEGSVLKHIDWLRETMWPSSGGGMLRESRPRTADEKDRSKTEASVMLATLIPDLAASVVGRANAQAAARRIFATMNNDRLNTHLAFTVLDEIIAVLFLGNEGRIR